MLANPERTVLVSSVGWVDRDVLWRYDVAAARAERLPLGTGAGYLSLHSHGSEYFSVAHHFEGERFELTVHSFSDPPHVLARTTVDTAGTRMVGDSSRWRQVPRVYAAYLGFEPWKDFVLVAIVAPTEQVALQRLDWYDETYDKGYQAITGVLELPGEDAALVSVQRRAPSWFCTICRRAGSGAPSRSAGAVATRACS